MTKEKGPLGKVEATRFAIERFERAKIEEPDNRYINSCLKKSNGYTYNQNSLLIFDELAKFSHQDRIENTSQILKRQEFSKNPGAMMFYIDTLIGAKELHKRNDKKQYVNLPESTSIMQIYQAMEFYFQNIDDLIDRDARSDSGLVALRRMMHGINSLQDFYTAYGYPDNINETQLERHAWFFDERFYGVRGGETTGRKKFQADRTLRPKVEKLRKLIAKAEKSKNKDLIESLKTKIKTLLTPLEIKEATDDPAIK